MKDRQSGRKQMKSDRRRLTKYFAFIFASLLVVSVLLSVGQFLYTDSLVKQDYQNNYENTFSLLRHSQDVIFEQTEFVIQRLLDNKKYENFVSYYQNNKMNKAIEVLDDLNLIKTSVNSLDCICLYYPESGLTLSTRQSVCKLPDYHAADFLMGLKDIDDPYNRTFSRRVKGLFSQKSVEVITLVRRIPRMDNGLSLTAYVVLDIRSDMLFHSFSEISIDNNSIFLVYDATGVPIYSTGDVYTLDEIIESESEVSTRIRQKTMSIGKVPYYVYIAKSSDTGWIYVYMQNSSAADARLIGIRRVFMAFCVFVIVLGGALSIYFARRLHRPIQELSNRLTTAQGDTDVFTRIDQMIEQNEELDAKLQNNAIIGRNQQLLRQLLLGFERDDSEIEQLHLREGEKDCLICLLNTTEDNNHLSNESLSRFLAPYHMRLVVKLYSAKHEIALIITGTKLEHDSIMEAARQIIHSLDSTVNAIGISQNFTNVSQLSEAYHQASTALGMHMVRGYGTVCHYHDIANMSSLSYPYRIESTIFHAIKTLNRHALKQGMAQFVNFFIENDTKARIVKDYFLQLFSSTQRLMLEIAIQKEEFAIFSHHDLLEADTIQEMEDYMLRIFDLLIRDRETVSNTESELVNQVCLYIEEHLDNLPTQEALADEFQVPLPTLRAEFQRLKDMSIKGYSDQLKLEKAMQMLMNPETKIQDIARKMGFGYSQSFIAFFKSATGMTPGEWRESAVTYKPDKQ